MSLRYIREYYGFTGKRGNACKVMGGKSGVITGSDGQYVRVRLHGENKSRIFHPSDIMFERKNESGLTQRAAVLAEPKCPSCAGTGFEDDDMFVIKCFACGGTGILKRSAGG